ncbi:MARH4 ligase, partial [Syrrhaptes paradoxus]|nr:MARH4 ligase [Syrrhaptes paradoxus]
MLIPPGAGIFCYCCCCGLLRPRQMLRNQGLLKCRCRMLFNDLKVFLLRRPPAPPPPSPPPPPLPMPGGAEGGPPSKCISSCLADAGTGPDSGAPHCRPWERSVQDTNKMAGGDVQKHHVGDKSSFVTGRARWPIAPAEIIAKGRMFGELLSPCRCDGSVKCTHQPCLIKWISERGCWSCELCYYKYHVIAISTKNPLQWQAISLTVIEKVQIAAAILGSLFLIASISWLIWSTFSPSAKWQRQDLLFQICYGMYGFMDIVCIGLIIHEGPSVYRIFKRWQAVNQQWKVLNYDKTKDMEEQKTGTRTNQRPSSQTTHSSSTGGTATNSAPADSGARAAGHATGTLSDHHCAYTILHILSHLRPHEQRSQSSSNRELVMRVTTV